MSMKAMIRQIAQEAIDELKSLEAENTDINLPDYIDLSLERGRAEFAEEVLEILNGEEK